jgi:glutathione S-transferase
VITLYTFGPAFGLPDPSPFVTKAEVLLKMAGLPYKTDTAGFNKAPKGKLPYIDDDGTIVRFTFVRIRGPEASRRFRPGPVADERGVAWAFEKMCEYHLYWASLHARWMDDANFDAGPRKFFAGVPAPIRPLVVAMVRRQVRRNLWGHGLGRHSKEEIEQLAARSINAIADFLADKPYLMGQTPCGAGATAAFMTGYLPASGRRRTVAEQRSIWSPIAAR